MRLLKVRPQKNVGRSGCDPERGATFLSLLPESDSLRSQRFSKK